MALFQNRQHAGALLAERLEKLNLGREICVLALPRGGVPVALEIASRLKAPLDLLFSKKIPAPQQPELAIGAMSEDLEPHWQQESLDWLKVAPADRKKIVTRIKGDLTARIKKWRKGKPLTEIKHKTVILVDDGIATGATVAAALKFLKKKGAKTTIVATPLASRSASQSLRNQCDQWVALQSPSPFHSVGQWYDDFSQITDKEMQALLEAHQTSSISTEHVLIPYDDLLLEGELALPHTPLGLIIFAHGSGSSRLSPRNKAVAYGLNQRGFATLLFDLLTTDEAKDRGNVFNIPHLADRLRNATGWALDRESLRQLPVGYFGASTGAAAALRAAAGDPIIQAVVSRGGRPDLAGESVDSVDADVLLIVGVKDKSVLELNQKAAKKIRKSKVVVIPSAGHLFEETGAMEQVLEYASNWFTQTLSKKINAEFQSSPEPQMQIIKSSKDCLRPLSEEGLDELAATLSDARIVMLGEASHGTEEFYNIRRLLSERLIANHGFKFIAVEGDWPDCYKLNKYIHGENGGSARAIMSRFHRWPTWMWANSQTELLIEWMREHQAGFYGLDVYSLYESIAVVRDHAMKLPADIRSEILNAYTCFDSFDRNEIAYSRSLIHKNSGCEEATLEALRRILRLRLQDTFLREEELFDAKQNARIIRDAERYYRSVFNCESESWNLRDQHMMDTLLALLQRYDDGAKGIVWAHNTHIGDYHATSMREHGYINLGGLAREHLGPEHVKLVGFGTFHGEVLAGRAWNAPAEVMPLPAARSGSYENHFHQVAQETGVKEFYLNTHETNDLSPSKGHRAVGVVYQNSDETHGRNYVPTDLAKRYDSFVFIDKTTALRAIPIEGKSGLLPESWPSGT